MNMPSTTIIRPAIREDLNSLVMLLEMLFSIEADFTADRETQLRGLEMLFESNQGCIIVAENRGMVVGMCSGQFLISTAEGGLSLVVEDVVVHNEWQGRGIGAMLMNSVGLYAKEHNASRLQLLADSENFPALNFYKNHGWESTRLICLRKRHS